MHSDFLDLLRLLNAHKVRYLIIGGYAYSFHVEPRYTKDLDLWVEASLPNARRLLKALTRFGAPVDNLTEEDLKTPGLLYVFGVPPLRVDILNRIERFEFRSAYKNRRIFLLGSLEIPVIRRSDLIRLKRRSGRPQDIVDLTKLSLTLTAIPRPRTKRSGLKRRS